MQHSPETLMQDLLDSIAEPPSVATMEATERELAKSARPPWTGEPFDCDAVIKAGLAGEVLPADFSRVCAMDPLTARITAVVEQELRRAAHRNDDEEPPEVNPQDDEPAAIPDDQVKADITLLKSKQAEGIELWQYMNDVLESDYERGKQLRLALAYLCDEQPALVKVAA